MFPLDTFIGILVGILSALFGCWFLYTLSKTLLKDLKDSSFNLKNLSPKTIISIFLQYATFTFVSYIGLLMTASTDPEMNWPIKFVGFFGWMYIAAKIIFPEKFAKRDIER